MKKELEELKNENGQISFAAAVFHDDEMSIEQKRDWLTKAVNTLQTRDEIIEAQEYLDKLNAEKVLERK